MEKLVFSLVTATPKLRPYFQAHVINVLTDHPFKKAMNKLEATRRLIQWVVELSEFDVRYWPREAIKAQLLADFIAKFTPTHGQQTKDQGSKEWIVNVDGSSTQHAREVGVVLQSPEGDRLEYAIRLHFQTTNNKAEYEVLIKGLDLVKALGTELVVVQGDSQLIIEQVNGTCEAKEE